jgi:hypothetical protein
MATSRTDPGDRVTIIKDQLLISFMVAQRPIPEPAMLEMQAQAWAEISLVNIPTAALPDAFAAAFQAQRTPYPLTAGEVLAAWDGIITERMRTGRSSAYPALPAGRLITCPRCHGAGHLLDEQSGAPGQRTTVRCDRCQALGQIPAPQGTAPETQEIGPLLALVGDWCAEQHDPYGQPEYGFWRLGAVLAIHKAGGTAYNFRAILETSGATDLATALHNVGIAVDPPQSSRSVKARPTPHGWKGLGELLAVDLSESTPLRPATKAAPERGHPHAPDKAPDPDRTRVAPPADQRR